MGRLARSEKGFVMPYRLMQILATQSVENDSRFPLRLQYQTRLKMRFGASRFLSIKMCTNLRLVYNLTGKNWGGNQNDLIVIGFCIFLFLCTGSYRYWPRNETLDEQYHVVTTRYSSVPIDSLVVSWSSFDRFSSVLIGSSRYWSTLLGTDPN